MKFSPAIVSVPAVLAAWCAVQACSSPSQQLATPEGDPDTNVNSNQGAAGTEAQPPPSGPPAAELGSAACATENPDPSCFPLNPDPNCNSTSASSEGDTACTMDCRVPCGFDGMGLKVCTCTNGTYESCPCARPDTYLGAPSATFCELTPNNLTAEIEELGACSTPWEQCVARDPVGGTPQGCVCLPNAETGEQEWNCGSTNNWFALESEDGTGLCEGANPDPRCFPINPDESCNSTNARSGSECTIDCLVGCGFQTMGLKTCVCQSGFYSTCPCPKPENYLGAPTAPPCQTPDGTGNTEGLDDEPCTVEWEQCIGTDAVNGNTPRGCACLTNRLSGALQWYCGSTNRWFAPA